MIDTGIPLLLQGVIASSSPTLLGKMEGNVSVVLGLEFMVVF